MTATGHHNPLRLEALQVLRAVAAAMVVFIHTSLTYGARVNPASMLNFWYDFGELGVKLFFCISGFIIFNSTDGSAPGISG